MRRQCLSLVLAAGALAPLALASPAAAALPDCMNAPAPRTVYSGQGTLESVIIGKGGRLYFTSTPSSGSGRLLKAVSPGSEPRVLTDGFDGPGGMAWSHRRLIVGDGNTGANGATGDASPRAGLFSINPVSGDKAVFAKGLGMANGVARAPDGTIFASNAAGSLLDRIAVTRAGRAGAVDHGWASVPSGNGMVVDHAGRFLYVNRTTAVPSAIARVEIANPANVTTFASMPEEPVGLLDGMARDRDDNLYVAAFGAGQVWRVDTSGRACILARGLLNPSAVAFGRGTQRFRGGNLYAVGWGGEVVELPGANKARYPG